MILSQPELVDVIEAVFKEHNMLISIKHLRNIDSNLIFAELAPFVPIIENGDKRVADALGKLIPSLHNRDVDPDSNLLLTAYTSLEETKFHELYKLSEDEIETCGEFIANGMSNGEGEKFESYDELVSILNAHDYDSLPDGLTEIIRTTLVSSEGSLRGVVHINDDEEAESKLAIAFDISGDDGDGPKMDIGIAGSVEFGAGISAVRRQPLPGYLQPYRVIPTSYLRKGVVADDIDHMSDHLLELIMSMSEMSEEGANVIVADVVQVFTANSEATWIGELIGIMLTIPKISIITAMIIVIRADTNQPIHAEQLVALINAIDPAHRCSSLQFYQVVKLMSTSLGIEVDAEVEDILLDFIDFMVKDAV